jgi:hypothetical protein
MQHIEQDDEKNRLTEGETLEEQYLREHRELSGSGLVNSKIADRESEVRL